MESQDQDIAETIKKLQLYQQQIKEQTKKEILNFVENRGDEYFKYMMEDAEDTDLNQINYRLKTIEDIGNMIRLSATSKEFIWADEWDQ